MPLHVQAKLDVDRPYRSQMTPYIREYAMQSSHSLSETKYMLYIAMTIQDDSFQFAAGNSQSRTILCLNLRMLFHLQTSPSKTRQWDTVTSYTVPQIAIALVHYRFLRSSVGSSHILRHWYTFYTIDTIVFRRSPPKTGSSMSGV